MRSVEAQGIMRCIDRMGERIEDLKRHLQGHPDPKQMLTCAQVHDSLNLGCKNKKARIYLLVREGKLKAAPGYRPMKFRVRDVNLLKGKRPHRSNW